MEGMADEKQRAHQLLDRLDAGQLEAIVRLLQVMTDPFSRSLVNAPVDDEPVSEEEAREIDAARASLEQGAGIPHEEVLAEFGLSPEDWKRLGRTPVDSRKAKQ
jgi:hypothetical protein